MQTNAGAAGFNVSGAGVTDKLFHLSSSLRLVSPQQTLSVAKPVAIANGITRVTEVTRLDRLGIPVFVSIRPDAIEGSLCVNAGKGLASIEAEVGATMEALEYAFAEYNRSHLDLLTVPAAEVLDGWTGEYSVHDLCPIHGMAIEPDTAMECVMAEEMACAARVLVPAELVFLPFRSKRHCANWFGSSSNGLCSGNSILEATVHGIAELIERDIRSFESFQSSLTLVRPSSIPEPLYDIWKAAASAGVHFLVGFVRNAYGIPYFTAILIENEWTAPLAIHAGYGCHPDKHIALTRAMCEAAQSRLSFIHGGRDDLSSAYNQNLITQWQDVNSNVSSLIAEARRSNWDIDFATIPDQAGEITSLQSMSNYLLSTLDRIGVNKVYRVVLMPVDAPISVVRVIVPRLEFFHEDNMRIGPRLRAFLYDLT